MKPRIGTVVTVCLIVTLGAVSAHAAGTSEARGLVTDPDGNPLKGVRLTFSNTANETAVYEASTNKKGRYFLASLLYYATGQWVVTAELEGYVPTKMSVVSKTQQAVIGKFETPLVPGKRPPNIIIRPFGEAEIDFIMTPEAMIAQAAQEKAEEEAAEVEKVVERQIDPYAAALQKASDGDLEGSLPLFEKAIKDAGDDPERLEAYAKVLYQVGRRDEAEAHAQEALAIDPGLVGPHLVLYSIHVSKKDYDAARQDLDRAGEIQPGNLQVMEQRAWLATETGRSEDAVQAYLTITENKPDHVEAWIALGGLYAAAGRNDESQQAYQKVVELDPKSAYQTFFNIGALIENKPNASDQDIRNAIEAYRQAVEIKPDYAQAHKRLAFLLLRTGDMAGTRASLERYLEVSPNGSDAAQVRGMLKTLPK